jgi:hypothetical protein
MPRFSVHIGETSTSIEAPYWAIGRDVCWEGEAEDDDAAKDAAYRVWDDKYGPGRQPVGAIITVTPIDGQHIEP